MENFTIIGIFVAIVIAIIIAAYFMSRKSSGGDTGGDTGGEAVYYSTMEIKKNLGRGNLGGGVGTTDIQRVPGDIPIGETPIFTKTESTKITTPLKTHNGFVIPQIDNRPPLSLKPTVIKR